MLMITIEQLSEIMPLAGARARHFLDPLNAAMAEFGIDTPEREAAFLAQAAHESGQLGDLVENLNYSADRLVQVFPRRFNPVEAAAYSRQPERIANHIYALRMSNGDAASGDGWRFRGRGIFQLTGRGNYAACSKALYNDEGVLIEQPELIETPEGACRSAGWFWQSRELNKWADADDFKTLTIRINGGLAGWTDRIGYYGRAQNSLGVA